MSLSGFGISIMSKENSEWKCLNVGECEKATRKTALVATQMCSMGYLPLINQTPSLDHNLSGDYFSVLIKFH